MSETDRTESTFTCETVSVVIPCYKSVPTIAKVVNLSREELHRLGYKTQFVLVNDCSGDGTFDEILRLNQEADDVTSIDLAKNFGQHGAYMCGLHYVTGDVVVLMDDDMQTHPSQFGKLFNALTDDVDIVFGQFPRHEAWWRRAGSWFWRWTMCAMTGAPKDLELSSFVVFRGWLAEEMCNYAGPDPMLEGLLIRTSSHAVNAEIEHFDREQGKSGYTLGSLIKLWSNMLNFSMKPLRIATAVGTLMGIVGLVSAFILVIVKLIKPDTQVGWSSLMVTLLTCSGLIILTLGVVGEYVGRVFMQANSTPQYVIRRFAAPPTKKSE